MSLSPGSAERFPGRVNEPLFPALALLLNALTWGLFWWPLRQLEMLGLHPLWATALMFSLATLWVSLVWAHAWREVLTSRPLWLVALAAGATNSAFNWAVASGDVVRVVLLFYLMPLWAAVLARWLLQEALTAWVWGRVALAMGGALVILWPASGTTEIALPWPSSLADGLGLAGGFFFALNNVLLRREAESSGASRALSMFFGGTLVAGACGLLLAPAGHLPWLPALAWPWVLGVTALSMVLLLSNFALQYGAARLPANVAAIFMLSEVIFATVSAIWLGSAELGPRVIWGGGLILLAAVLALMPSHPSKGSHVHTS
ncbi:MAG: DMT family transporter [Burkholderiales bacterium]